MIIIRRPVNRSGGGVCLLALLSLAGCGNVPVFLPAGAGVSSRTPAQTILAQDSPSRLLAEVAIHPETSSTASGTAGSLPAAAAGHSGPIVNESSGKADAPLPDSQDVADDALLDGQRGGFDSGGLVMSFGILQAAYVNGQLVSSQSLNVADVSKLAAGVQGAILASGGMGNLTGFTIVQNGAGNTAGMAVASVTPAAAAGNIAISVPAVNTAGLVLQNTINNQVLQTLTTINASLNSLQLLRNMNLQASIRDSVLAALRK